MSAVTRVHPGAGVATAIVLVAMPDEEAPFLAKAQRVDEAVQVGNSFQRLIELAGTEVLLVRTGIGLVNASSAATAAILAAPDARVLVSAGSAGGLGAEVRVGDVVLGEEYINVDADARAFGYVLGQVPRMPASYAVHGPVLDVAAASTAAEHLAGRQEARLLSGLLVSSYSFVSPERAALILADFPAALATDMESSAIAQVAHVFGRPFVSVRGVSDLCGPTGDEFLTHVDDAADRSAEVVLALLPGLVA